MKSSEAIAEFIGESPKVINHLVEFEGLPAWKRNGQGPWRALSCDLERWLIYQRNRYLSEERQTVIREVGNVSIQKVRGVRTISDER